jgi:Polyketide cyclase / dehydrase and lipid transport
VRVACRVEIDRPAREVWAYVADYGDMRWRAGVSQLCPSRPGPAQAGVTTPEALRLLGATFRTDATIHRVDAGRLLEWRAHDRQKDVQGSRLVEPTGGAAPASPRSSTSACLVRCGRSGR